MNNKLQVQDIKVPEVLVEKFNKLGITNNESSSLMLSFGAPLVEVGEILDTYKNIVVTDESQIDLMKEAKEKRLSLKKIRTGVENTRKELKSEYLRKGDAIQAVANYIKENIEPAEKYLELQEKFAEIKKAERAIKVKQERTEKLMQYTDNISMYAIDNIDDETFETLLAKIKKEYDDKIAAEKAEAERLAKEEVERKAEQERIIAENERLKKYAEAKEKADNMLRNRINIVTALGLHWSEGDQSYIMDDFNIAMIDIKCSSEKDFTELISSVKTEIVSRAKKQAELDKIESDKRQKELAEERAKVEAERAKIAAIESEQRKKDEAIAKEKADKEAAEAKAIADAKEAEMNALLAPDKDKLLNFSKCLETIRTEKLPAVKTKQAQDVVNLIDEMFTKMRGIIETKAKEL